MADSTLRVRWLDRLSFRRKLALVVGIPSLVALFGAALSLTRVVAVYRRAQALDEANRSSTFLIQAAAAQAKERGFTAAVLSDPNAEGTRRQIAELRAKGDGLLATALTASHPALTGNRVLQSALSKLESARQDRDRKRAEIDTALNLRQTEDQSAVQSWFDAQTALILAERNFGSALFLAQNPYELVLQYNGYIKANVFEASEFAGRERARIGRIIATGKPITPAAFEEMQRWRGVVEENLAAIAQLRANPAMPDDVVNGIGDMELAFLGDYEKIRQAVYGASARGESYPLTTDQWISASTRAINAILAVSDEIGDEAARISRQQADFSEFNVLLLAGLMAALLLAVAASILISRRLTRRFAELRAAAMRVGAGDYAQPVSHARRGADEFALLAQAFNDMQNRLQVSVRQLQEEKAHVEERVVERTAQLTAVNEQLVSLSKEKDTLLGICSHDLKNPLSGIRGLADLIRRDPHDASVVQEHASDILKSSDFMFGLVANLLDSAAIEQGKLRLHLESLDLGYVAECVVKNYHARAEEKHIALSLATAPGDLARIVADRHALTQVIDNLISNAIKYTPAGGEVDVALANVRGEAVAITVRDTGPGLSTDDQSRLFEKFVRLSARPTGGEHASGLGLSIVKRLVEAMGGVIWCRSELGRGSVFAAEFPVAQVAVL